MSRLDLSKSALTVIILFLFFAQLIFTVHSIGQLRYEEVAESIRNVFWLQNSFVYDGISSNIGWYGLLLIVYNIFGFSIYYAKIVRLFLSLVSIISLALLLKKYLGYKAMMVPLVTICLSPTILFFNTLQTSYGIDLQYLMICLYLVDSLQSNRHYQFYFKEALLWVLAMLAMMSYPSFIFYLPILMALYIWKLRGMEKRHQQFAHMMLSSTTFVLPLLMAVLLISDRSLLIYDPVVKSGIFRGSGAFVFNTQMFFYNFSSLLSDIFLHAKSYNFDLYRTEFSGIYPAVTVIFCLIFSLWLAVKNHQIRPLVLLIWFSIFFILILINCCFDPTGRPGIRRSTSLLAFIYSLYAVCWYYIYVKSKNKILRVCGIVLLLLIPLHHLLAFPKNFSHLKDESPYKYFYFSKENNNDFEKTLDKFVTANPNQELWLSCKDSQGNPLQCRYAEIYAAVAGSCYWNHLKCPLIRGYDAKSGSFIYLKPDLWRRYYWEH